jgi:CRP-like cAMP-binding protein
METGPGGRPSAGREGTLNTVDRRNEESGEKLRALIGRIPIFSGLPAGGCETILSLCTKIALDRGDILCTRGEPSDSMFLLLFGKLAVRIEDSAVIATIDPVTSIGEMGVFTGEPRSATVEAMERSALLRLASADIDHLTEAHPEIGIPVMRNVIRILAERVSADNMRILEFQYYLLGRDEKAAPKDRL